ncbi:MAG: CotH kinase family protein [Oscillospiraceae bacterium]
MRRIMCMVLSILIAASICGCSDSNSGSVSDSSIESTSSVNEKTPVKPLEETYYSPNYVPDPSSWGGAAAEILGSVGDETDALIPSVFINCSGDIDREEYIDCVIQIDGSMTEEYSGVQTYTATIRGRGHSTWDWEKKPYKIKLAEKDSILKMNPSKNWVLIANYADESLLRNTTAFAMSEYLGSFDFTPKAVPVNVYLNGVYQGIYTIGEQIESKASRLDLDYREDSPNTGYLLEVGGADPQTDQKGLQYFDLPSGCAQNILICAPDNEKLTQANYDYIYKYMCLADEAITSLDGYETYIDVNSFIDWFIIHELSYNLDSCFHRSCFLYKDRGGKLKMGPVWDFDLAFGNLYYDNPNYNDWATVGSSNSNSYIGVNWFNYLMNDPSFREKARARWDSVKDGLVEAAMDSIEENRAKLLPSVDDNFAVWDTLGIANGYQPQDIAKWSTYNEQVAYLRRFITNRAAWIDENL